MIAAPTPDSIPLLWGAGPRWRAIEVLWERTVARLGYGERPAEPPETTSRRPERDPQLRLL